MISENIEVLNKKLELWKYIKDYEDCYQISSFGRVKSMYKNSNKILKQSLRSEYLGIQLNKNNKGKTFSVHRLVAISFIRNNDDTKIVNHIDGNKINNHILNLEWISCKENRMHAEINKLFIPKCIKVTQYSKDKKTLIKIFNSVKEAMELTKISDSKICMVCKGKRNHAGGYFWKYTDFDYENIENPDGKEIEEYPNYIVTKDGKIYSKSHKKYISSRDNSGYQYVTLYNNSGKGKDFSIHYLVATLYIPNLNNFPIVNHKNHNRSDNIVENLEWVTYNENMIHFGKKNGKSVIKLDKNDNILQIYDTIKDASIKNNITSTNITNVCKQRQKTAGGFKWKYNENKELASPI
jgi:hypothetical protein